MHLLVWTLDSQRYGLPIDAVDRVLRAVAPTALPGAPAVVSGMIDVGGRITALIDMRGRLGLPPRAVRAADSMVLARTERRPLAFFADVIEPVIEVDDDAVTAIDAVADGTRHLHGIGKTADGLVLIQDLERFLSFDEEIELERALHA
jgi:purine-binding chemotaxis protein CheW